MYLQLGRYREAEERFRKTLSIRVNYVDAYSNLARLYDKLERPSDAIASLRMALRYSPENAWVRSELERREGKKAGKP
ncbi:MAG: tetratricopeptide repeat protein [Acidobacteria bacterium]|nr:tetratricopeptide repeat protein [Acidobacteriota bacterium]